MSIFRQVKNSVDIVDVAERYGLSVNRHKKAICPFHVDTSPSLSFKDNRFTCFACGANGDVIDLICQLTNLDALGVVKELNTLYHLGFELDKALDSREAQRIQYEREQRAAFREWECEAVQVYSEYIRLLRKWKQDFAPKADCDVLDFRFVKALSQLEYLEYVFENVFIGSDDIKRQFYREHKDDVSELKRKLAAGGCEELLLWHPKHGLFKQAYAVA